VNQIKPPEPGIHENIPFAEYCAWPYVNNSSLAALRRSPAHYKAAMENQREPTEAMLFGTLAHAGKLEPLSIPQNYIVMPRFEGEIRRDDGSEYSNVKASKAYKEKVEEFHSVNTGKEIVSQDMFDNLIALCDSLSRNELSAKWLRCDGPAEVSLVWDDPITGLRCKARCDKLDWKAKRITDLKTTRDCMDFCRSLGKYGYARQAAFYRDGLGVLTGDEYEFCIVAVEKEPPFGVMSAPMSEDTLVAGHIEYRKALNAIYECGQSQEWPGYSDPPAWELPHYMRPDLTLTVNGEITNI